MNDMFDIQREELIWAGRKLILETGKMARQADGAVVATYGETTVLATVVSAKEPKAGVDFFPLTVNYQERTYAAGRIPGGYFKREGRPTEKETLVSRLIDRPIRPLFVEGYKNDTQVVVTVLSHDLENDPDVVAMVAASAALTLSGVPFMGPVGAARVGYIGGQYKLNPPLQEMEDSSLDLIVAGTADAVLMVESEAKELAEDVMLGAVMFGHKHFQPVIEAIIRLAEKAAKEPRDYQPADVSEVEQAVLAIAETRACATPTRSRSKQERYAAVDAVKAKVMAELLPAEGEAKFDPEKVKSVFKDVQAKIVRWNILDDGQAHRRPRRKHRPSDPRGGRRPAAHPRLGAVHPRRDAGARRDDARHRRGRAVHRRARRNPQGDLPAALQLPALFGRRDGPHGLARPARDRPRQARLARHPSDAAGARTSSRTRSASSRRSPSRTARPRWRPCAAPRLP